MVLVQVLHHALDVLLPARRHLADAVRDGRARAVALGGQRLALGPKVDRVLRRLLPQPAQQPALDLGLGDQRLERARVRVEDVWDERRRLLEEFGL